MHVHSHECLDKDHEVGRYVQMRLWVLYPLHLYFLASLAETWNQNRMERMRTVTSGHVCVYVCMYERQALKDK